MTRAQRRVHLLVWAALAVLLLLGMVAGLMVRPAMPAAGVVRGAVR